MVSQLSARLISILVAASLSAPAVVSQRPGEQLLPSLDDATLAWDSAAGEPLALEQLTDRLAKANAVFVGETHLDDTTHRIELLILEALLAKTGGKVVLSLEMFERDVQSTLDAYVAGRIDEAVFLEKARPWGNYRTGYRPLIEAAKRAGIPVVAANTPVMLRRRLAMGGRAALDALSPAQRELLPDEIFPASQAYWDRVDRAVRGHSAMMGMAPTNKPAEERLYEGQNLWDNSMGAACAESHAAHPDHVVLHVAGGFHVAYREGTVAQFLRRAPGAKALVVSIEPIPSTFAARPERDASRGDFLVYAGAFARGLQEGTHAVEVPAELRYTIDLPDTATDARPAPVLVWLQNGTWRNSDLRALWKAALGDSVAVIVVHPPYPEVQPDLGPGGRWAQTDGFRADYSRLVHGIERIVEYVARRFPVDRDRLIVAGDGAGGTAALWTAMYTDWLDVDFLAISPTGTGRLRMEGLPDRAPSTKLLRLAGLPDEGKTIAALGEDYREVGVATEVSTLKGEAFAATETAVRDALGLPPRSAPNGETVYCVVEPGLPRARQWAEVYARGLEAKGTPAQVGTESELPKGVAKGQVRRLSVGNGGAGATGNTQPLWRVTDFADGSGLPLAGGSFGGTTVVVLPAGTSDAERAAWQNLEKSRAIKRRSFFANLAIATEDGKPGLAELLAGLRDRGRSRMLIVPASFCADAATMRRIREQAGADLDGLDLLWLPGLGAELCRPRER